jgi:2-C-methyl-D-erythritol 2,4-cyclodiphosphate synthase
MRKTVADHCRVDESKINIKATTTEKLGWIGEGEGMAATAVVLLGR